MYTLEDDKETTSSLRKSAPLTGNMTGSISSGMLPSNPDPTLNSLPENGSNQNTGRISLSLQVTNTFRKITTPTKVQTSGKRAALAALTVACICVFFTAMDQTVVVTALPPIITDLGIGPTKLDHAAWIVSAYLL